MHQAGGSSVSRKVFLVVNAILMVLFMLVILYPILNMFSISLSEDTPVLTGRVTFYPQGLDFGAYEKAFQNRMLMRSYMNTIYVSLMGCICSLVLTSFAAYPLAYGKFYGKKVISFLIMFTMWFSAGMIPTFMVVRNLGLVDNLFSLVAVSMVSAYNTIILRNYYESIPISLVESGYLDGANDFQILAHIITPMAKPALAIIALWVVVGHWNEFFNPLIYINSIEKYTLQMVLRDIVIDASGTELYGMAQTTMDGMSHTAISEQTKNAVVFLAIFPMLVLYPFLQKYFVQGMMIGAVKG
ncbi:MAG: carbohydrate ABC transporter permease [Clostridia bacterium]|nr:carbohydrate ABC transporter permease [Clostridia bacterium]